MPLSFNFEEELARQSALAVSQNNPNQANLLSLGNAVFKDVIGFLGEIDMVIAGSVYYELHWNTMMAQCLFDYLAEKGEKCEETKRPCHTYKYSGVDAREFVVEVKHFMENGDMVLKCRTVCSDESIKDHSVRLSDVVKTS